MFREALRQAFVWSAKWYFGSFASSIGTFLLLYNSFQFDLYRSIRYGVAIIFVTFLLKTIYQYILQVDALKHKVDEQNQQIDILENIRQKKKLLISFNFYGESIIILKNVFSKFHFLRKKEEITQKEMMTSLIYLCNEVKRLFEKRFKHKYSVCIKVLNPNVDLNDVTVSAEIITLCRDLQSHTGRSVPSGIAHNIFENTCFNEIFHNIDDPNKSHYLNNDLPEDRYYKNSSTKIYGEIPLECTTTDERRDNWSLPYKSELVVPITPVDIEEGKDEDRRKQFLGYLCVDCNDTDSFHGKYDIEMLKGVADGIFDIIQQHSYKKS